MIKHFGQKVNRISTIFYIFSILEKIRYNGINIVIQRGTKGMEIHATLYTTLYVINLSLSGLCLIYMIMRDYKKVDHTHWSLVLVVQFVNIGYVALSRASVPEEALAANDLLQLDGSIMPLILLLSLTSAMKVHVPKLLSLVGYITALSHWLFIWYGSRNGMYYSRVEVIMGKNGSTLNTDAGPWKWIHYIYIIVLFVIMIMLITQTKVGKKRENNITARCFTIIIMMIVSAYVVQIYMEPEFEFLPFFYTICAYIIAYCYERNLMYDIEGIASQMNDKSNAAHGYLAFDLKRRYLGANDKAHEMIPELEKFTINEIVSRDKFSQEFIQFFEKDFNALDAGEVVKKYVNYRGLTYHFSLEYFTIRQRGGKKGYMYEVTDDTERQKYIDEIKQYNSDLQESTKKAQIANEAKGRFLANMSHEIRTPINAVLGLDTMILRESKEPQIVEYARDIDNAGKSLLALINDILDLSKIESGKMEIHPLEYEMSSLINDVHTMIHNKAKEKGLAFQTELDETLPNMLWGDDVRIRQILINLLNNAVKYTEEGSVTLAISGEIISKDLINIHFEIRDTGVGIKDEDREKLFTAYERINEEDNRNIEGTGLGMSITLQLLELMQSKLIVESEYGRGSVFSFDLRQGVRKSEPIGDLSKRLLASKESYHYETSFVAPDAKVLIVDDMPTNRKVFAKLLSGMQIQIDEAGGGVEGLNLILNNKYDIIFLDHMMPDLDGIEVMYSLQTKSSYINQSTPKVVLTANAVVGAKEQYMEVGFDEYLSKPIDVDKLESVIARYLPEELKKPAEKQEAKLQKEEVSLPEIKDIEWEYALFKMQEEDIVKEVVADFSLLAQSDMDKLQNFYDVLREKKAAGDVAEQEKAFSDYRIKVHAMKTTAAMFGANTVAALARVLEYAAAEQDFARIERMMDVFKSEWLSLKQRVDEAFEFHKESQNESTETIAKEMLNQYLQALIVAIETVDLDTADSIIEELKKYHFEKIQKEYLDGLTVAVRNIDMEATKELAKKWMEG